MVVIFALGLAPVLAQQADVPPSQENGQSTKPQKYQLSPLQVQTLLLKPGGLEAAAGLVGHFVIHSEPEVWGRPDLHTLVKLGELIALGSITKRQSRLSSDGGFIYTDYVLHPLEILKGSSPGDLTFYVDGGIIEFANGTSAKEKTIAWEELQVGQTYVVLLNHDEEYAYYPGNGIESLVKISLKDGSLDSFAAHDFSPHRIQKDIEGLKADAFLKKLWDHVASK